MRARGSGRLGGADGVDKLLHQAFGLGCLVLVDEHAALHHGAIVVVDHKRVRAQPPARAGCARVGAVAHEPARDGPDCPALQLGRKLIDAPRTVKHRSETPGRSAHDGGAVAGSGVEPKRLRRGQGGAQRAEERLGVERALEPCARHAPRTGQAEEVTHERLAVLGEDRLGVELHTPVVQARDLERLDRAVLGAGVDFQTRVAGCGINDAQRVVAHHVHALREAREDALAGMGEGGQHAVLRCGAVDRRTGEEPESLVSEAHPEQRKFGLRCGLDGAPGGPEILVALRGAGAGGDDDMGELPGADARGEFRCLWGVAADHQGFAAGHLRHEVGEVVGVGIAVVQQQDHGADDLTAGVCAS